jgi:hypothetical protein
LQLYRLTFWTRHSTKVRLELQDGEKSDSTTKLATTAIDADSSVTASDSATDAQSINDSQNGIFFERLWVILFSIEFYNDFFLFSMLINSTFARLEKGS